MKFKVGDKVRVREDLKAGNFYGFYINKEMAELKGRVVEIEDVYSDSYSIKEDTYYWTEKMFSGLAEPEPKPKNLIPLIAKELGVEIGEEFEISNKVCVYKFTEDGLMGIESNGTYNASSIFFELISGEVNIIKLPSKPKLTEDEKVILRNISKKYKYIARDFHKNNINVFHEKPNKRIMGLKVWSSSGDNEELFVFNHLFKFIKWEDEEPYNIEELLEGLEDDK